MKKCSKCQEFLPESSFNKRKKSSDGLQSECRECHKKRINAKITVEPPRTSNLEKVNSRDLILELRRRGYSGELSLTQKVKI